MSLRMGVIEETEAALVAHWSLLGRAPRGALHDENGIRWYETPVPSLPYNGVVATRLPDGPDADAPIARVWAASGRAACSTSGSSRRA